MAKKNEEVAVVPESALTSLAALGDDEDVDTPVSYIGFHSSKSGRAGDIESQIPGITEGSAYVCSGNVYQRCVGVQVMSGQRRYYTNEDDEGNILDASVTESDSCKKECVLTVTLAYTESEIIPTVSTFKTTKTRLVRDFISAAALTKGENWLKIQGPIGKHLVDLPPRLRVVGYLTSQQKTSRAGRRYFLARATSKTLNDSQVELLIAAMGDEGFNKSLTEASTSAAGRWNWLESKFINA